MTLLALLVLAHAGTDPNEQAQLVNLVNGYRRAHGVEILTVNEPLCRLAEGHAGFMFSNQILTHEESPDKKGFTGARLEDRAKLIGWKDECSELVGYANTGVADSVQAIFDSPCHRVRFLKPGRLSLGAAAQGEFVCLLVGGEASKSVVLSPPDGATNVPVKWRGSTDYSGTRTGSGSKLFGYPLVFIDTNAGDRPLQAQKAELTDETGAPVEFELRSPANDRHFDTALTLIPVQPLKKATRYTAHVVVKLADGRVEDKTWSFSTDN